MSAELALFVMLLSVAGFPLFLAVVVLGQLKYRRWMQERSLGLLVAMAERQEGQDGVRIHRAPGRRLEVHIPHPTQEMAAVMDNLLHHHREEVRLRERWGVYR